MYKPNYVEFINTHLSIFDKFIIEKLIISIQSGYSCIIQTFKIKSQKKYTIHFNNNHDNNNFILYNTIQYSTHRLNELDLKNINIQIENS